MGKHNSNIPDRWNAYSAIGAVIPQTRFIAFKVPLKPVLTSGKLVEQFTPNDLLKAVVKMGYNLGMIIDLTYTDRYYDYTDFTGCDIQYRKIAVEGHHVPSVQVQLKFFAIVDKFLRGHADNNLMIGVHCTHGVNRTGYLLCRYMIDRLHISPTEAMAAFHQGRGHPMERANYCKDLNCWESRISLEHYKEYLQKQGKHLSTYLGPVESLQSMDHGDTPMYIGCELGAEAHAASVETLPKDDDRYRCEQNGKSGSTEGSVGAEPETDQPSSDDEADDNDGLEEFSDDELGPVLNNFTPTQAALVQEECLDVIERLLIIFPESCFNQVLYNWLVDTLKLTKEKLEARHANYPSAWVPTREVGTTVHIPANLPDPVFSPPEGSTLAKDLPWILEADGPIGIRLSNLHALTTADFLQSYMHQHLHVVGARVTRHESDESSATSSFLIQCGSQASEMIRLPGAWPHGIEVELLPGACVLPQL